VGGIYLPAPDEALWIGVARLVLHVPRSLSLKDRRRAVQSVVQRIRARHHCDVAEVGHLDNPGAAVVAATVVANDPKLVRARLDLVRATAELGGDAWLAEFNHWVQKMGEPGIS
jgi:uncharacterized protein YlxP (DUF503 family)